MQIASEELSLEIVEKLLLSEEQKIRLSEILVTYDIKKIYPESINPDLQEKIELFLSGKQLEGLSKITISGYKLHLKIFSDNVKKEVKNINTNDIRTYLSKYKDQKVSTISTKLSVLKSFFGWLTAEDILPKDPTTKIKPPRKEKRMPKALSIEELEMLRESCSDIRKRALIEVLYATGCRLAEVHSLNRDDVNFNTQSCRVIGKGNKEREVFFSFKAMYYLRKYLLSRSDNVPALFVTERKEYRRLSMRGIQREVGIVAKTANLHKKVSPHCLRHTFATLTLNNGAELVAVQQLLGHEDPSTTQIYAQISPERKRENYRKYLVQ